MGSEKKIRLMEVCGTHTMAIARSGIKKLLPAGIELISGPGCPVCVTAQKDIDRAVKIASREDVIMTTFGDMLRVPGSGTTLDDIRSRGGDVRVVYSSLDALDIARDNPSMKVVFMGVGFETTSPTVAATLKEAERRDVRNFFVLSCFKVIFPALEALVIAGKTRVDGFICPGHVSVITGSAPYERFAAKYKKPCVITGFEASDIIKGIGRLVRQIKSGKSGVEIEYKRAVKEEGNIKARSLLRSVFDVVDSDWRGLGAIRKSGLRLKGKYRRFDAERKFGIRVAGKPLPRGCACGKVLQGIISPADCALFGKKCAPSRPVGPCMVSSEGACAAHFRYGER